MIKQLDDLELHGKTVLVQSNLDVPLQEGHVTDDTRLKASLQTIQELTKQNCRVILLGHIGRPKGRDPKYSLEQIIPRLRELLNQEVTFLPTINQELVDHLPQPAVAVLENIRMWPGENDADETFAKELASLADAFVNDDYIDSHRAGAANTQLPKLLPSCMGRTLHREWSYVRKAIDNPDRPLTIIIGGAKKDKLEVVEHVLPNADHILLGGVLANTFLAASGVDVQNSKYDKDNLQKARELLRRSHGRITLPTDCVAAKEFRADSEHETCYYTEIPEGWQALDLGPHTIKAYQQLLQNSKTIIWGGPIGVFEFPVFAHASRQVARTVASTDAYSLIAGGDSAAAINQLGLADQVSHVSIGGGATLHLIAGDELPAISALREATQ